MGKHLSDFDKIIIIYCSSFFTFYYIGISVITLQSELEIRILSARISEKIVEVNIKQRNSAIFSILAPPK